MLAFDSDNYFYNFNNDYFLGFTLFVSHNIDVEFFDNYRFGDCDYVVFVFFVTDSSFVSNFDDFV